MPSSSASGTEPVCWVCLEGGDSGELLHENGELHSGGCACRGAAGFAHLPCLMKTAQANPARWTTCPTCTQPWTGSTSLCLALSRHRLAAELDDEPEHFNASWQLIDALRDSGEFAEASRLGKSTLENAKRVYGDEHVSTLYATEVLARVYSHSGDYAAALPLQTHVLTLSRRTHRGGKRSRSLSSPAFAQA